MASSDRVWRLGSLCTGTAAMDMAVGKVIPVEHVWHADNDRDVAAVLAANWPGVANLGDIKTVDWAAVPAVDIVTAGFPCQDVSVAGKRAGIRPDTRSGLWLHIAYAIGQLRPSLVVIENVGGLLSARADRGVEPNVAGVDPVPGNALRAAGAVFGDLADIGYDACWTTVAASDIGAPHRRRRVFIAAWPTANTNGPGGGQRSGEWHPRGRRESADSGRLVADADAARLQGPGAGGLQRPGQLPQQKGAVAA